MATLKPDEFTPTITLDQDVYEALRRLTVEFGTTHMEVLRQLTTRRRRKTAEHGTITMANRGCTCQACRDAMYRYRQSRRVEPKQGWAEVWGL
jgi:predicted CopG family antitoxin